MHSVYCLKLIFQMGQSPTSWFTDNSVVACFFRCYTIHGTHSTLVTRNTAFNSIGHCYYMEDGVEENNTISFNQAAKIAFIGPLANTGMGRAHMHTAIQLSILLRLRFDH